MADWGQNDEVVTPTKTVAKQSSWGQDDEVVTKPALKQEAKPTDSTVGKLVKSFIGGTASALDFPLSAPGFIAATGTELLTTTGSMLAIPFTGETPKQAYQRGAKTSETVGQYLMNPMQKLVGLFQEADYYSNAPLPQLMGWFSDKLQKGGEKLEAATGIPSEAVPLVTNVGMLAAGAKGVKTGQELLKEKQQPFKVAETLKKQEVSKTDITPPPLSEGATPNELLKNIPKDISNKDRDDLLNWVSQAILEKNKRTLDSNWIEGQKKNFDKRFGEGFTDRVLAGEFKGEIYKLPSAEQFKKEEFLAKTKKIKAERDSSAPLVEAAIRNKETGELELMGPKHDDARKAETVDTHEQGFVDERGNFHTREAAVDQAKRAGQLPEDHVLEIPEDGLHSGDLRKVGDERFAITEDQPAGVPKKPSLPDEPVVDTTKTSPRDVKDDKEFLSIATDIYEKHGEVEAVDFYKGWEEFKKTWAEPVKEVEEFVGINLVNKEANARIIHNNTADLKKLAGKDVNLEQISFDIDKGVPLEGKAKDVATKFRALMDDLGQQALESGVIKGWHENYVARNVVSEGAAPKGALEEFMRDAFGYGDKASGNGTKTTTKYGQERKLKTREDLTNHINGINTWLEQNGKDYRFKLKTDNLADIYKDYALSVQKAIENKNLIDNIKQIRNVNGESLIRPITDESPRPYGYKSIEHADLDNYAIHPDLVPALKFVFDAGPGMTMQALGNVSQVVKRINVIGSFFHAKSLMEVQSSAMIPLWTPFKEALVLPAIELAIKKTTGKDLQLSAVSKAVEQYRNGGLGDNVDTWIREAGLQLEVPEDVARGILSSTGKLADTLIGKYGPKTRVLEKSLSTVEKYTLRMFDKYTWDYLHTGSKIMVADAYLEKARLQAAKEGKPFDESVSRKEIAAFVNDSFGGLNWFDAARRTESEFAKRMAMAAYSPAGRRALQVALFAPDWTISTVRAFSSALPKGLNPTKWQPVEGIKGMVTPTTKADYARLYQFKTAIVYFTLINAINNMTADRDIWDNKDPTRIEWPDGTSMQAMKHAMEPYHWIADPMKTLSNKLGFIPKALIIGFGGVEYASPTAPKLVDLSLPGRAKAVAGSALPFQVQAGASAPEGEGVQRALLGTMGFPVYGKTAEQNKQARAERELALKENAWKYREKEMEAGRMPRTPKHEREKLSLERQRRKLNKEAEEE